MTVVWAKPREPERELAPGEFVRDGRILSTPCYGGDRRDDDVVEGELALPAQMIEHEAAPAEPAAIEEPELACSRSGVRRRPLRASGDRRLDSQHPIRSPPVCSVVSRSSRGRIGRKRRTARRERAFIGPVTPNGVLNGKRRRGRRWGSRTESFRSEGSRRVRGAGVARVARSAPAAAVGRELVGVPSAAAGSAGARSTMIAAGKARRPRGQSQAARQGTEIASIAW